MERNLVYTIALDREGETGYRNLAKLLVSSLLRTRFSGDILVFHTTPYPLFMVARAGVREVQLELPRTVPQDGGFATFAHSFKHQIASHIDASRYEKIMFLDCDTVALRNLDHLLEGDWDLAVYAETASRIQDSCWGAYLTPDESSAMVREGYNSGTLAVRASRFTELLERWQAIEQMPASAPGFNREQGAFNRVVLDWDGGLMEWPREEIALPLVRANLSAYPDYMRAALVHAASGYPLDYKSRFLFGVFATVFLHDTRFTLLNTFEM